jgi:Protein of unknown function (DUF2752)
MVPPTGQTMEDRPPVRRRTAWWVRGSLILIAGLQVLVFVIATQVRPYASDGTPLRMASHQSLGLPPCNFQRMFNLPCPSCGMTTSFALLVRGDVVNSMRANWVGTGLAVFCALLVPWCLVSALRGRYLFVRRLEGVLPLLVGVFTVTMLLRWGVVLLLMLAD